MSELIPLAIAVALILAAVIVIRLRVRRKVRSGDLSNINTGVGGSRGRPGADKH